MLRYSVRLNSLDYLAITRLDILDGLPKIKMCVGYKYQGEVLKRIPASLNVLAQVEPIYEEFEGWLTDISSIRKYEDLPANAKKYLERLSEVAGVELGIVSEAVQGVYSALHPLLQFLKVPEYQNKILKKFNFVIQYIAIYRYFHS